MKIASGRSYPLACAIGVAAITSVCFGSSPELRQIIPRGAQRGTEMDVTFSGARLTDPRQVLIYDDQITAGKPEMVNPQTVKVHLKVAADATLGEHVMRLRTGSGVSELRNFFVGPYPVVEETAQTGASRGGANLKLPEEKQPSTFEKPQKVPLNVTVAGVVELEQADFYSVECKKGQRLSVEVEGMRLGEIFDPYIAILDTSKAELATADDTALLKQDCFASIIVPHDGQYIIQIRDSSYLGSAEAHYRMHIGAFPRPLAVYPPGGKAGDEMDVQFIGDVSGPMTKHIKIPDTPGEQIALFAEQDGLTSPSGNLFRISAFPNVLEQEPNDEMAHATVATGALPLALNGVIDKPGDVDFFKFKASKGEALNVRVIARGVRSPLDSVLTLYSDKGGQIASNDDSGGPDSYLRFNAPADGEYALSIRDQLDRGGPEYVYRIEITRIEPTLAVTFPNFSLNGQPSQERQTIVIPRGGRFGTLLRVKREEMGGEVALSADGLPAGVTMHAEPAPPGQDVIPLVFEASADAAVNGNFCRINAKAIDGKTEVNGDFTQSVALVLGPNNNPYSVTEVSKPVAAVVDALPYSIQIVPPKVPLVQSGSMDLKIKIDRKGDFKGPVKLRTLWDPPGVSSISVDIPPDKSEVSMTLNANSNAATKAYKLAVIGEADVQGPAWTSTELTDFQVAPALVSIQIAKSKIQQGQSGDIVCKIDQKTPFPGKAKLELLGLPALATTEAKEISSDDKEVTFHVTTDSKTPVGVHSTLLCRLTLIKDGEPIVQTAGQNGLLRIDPAGGAHTANPIGKSKEK